MPDPDHNNLLHDVSSCPLCVTRLDRGIRDLDPEVPAHPGLWEGPDLDSPHTLPWHDRPMAHCPTCAPLLGLGEPVDGAPGWYEGATVDDPLVIRFAHAGDPGRAQPCTCRRCRPLMGGRVFDLGPSASFRVVDDVQADDTGLQVSGRLDPAALAALYGVPSAMIGDAESDWSDPDVGICHTWHDQVPADSHCAVCLWAPRDEGAFAQTTDPCVCQRGMRHSCGRAVGTVPDRGTAEAEVAAATEAELEPRGRWDRWVDRFGWAVVYWLTVVSLFAMAALAVPGWWFLATYLTAILAAPKVIRWARPQPNPVEMPGWEIRRGRTIRLPRLSIWQQPPLKVGLWRWRHSLDGGPWSPWWPALTQARAQRAVGRWLPFPMPTVPDQLPPDFPAELVPDTNLGHYRPEELVTADQMDTVRRLIADQAQVLTADQVRTRAAWFLQQAGIPLASVFPPTADPEVALEEASFEGVTIAGPGDLYVNTSVAAVGEYVQPPGAEPGSDAHIMDAAALDQPCYRCGDGRVLLSDLTGLCEPCKEEMTG